MTHLLDSLDDIVEMYDGWIIDIWGVIHNGVAVFPGVPEVFQKLKSAGKKIILLSNAPRRISIAKNRLQELGLSPDKYDALYTSGEACHNHLRDKNDPFYKALGKHFYHIGPVRDHTVFQGLDHIQHVDKIADADFLLITGTYASQDLLAVYEPLLQAALTKTLPCICANTDRRVVFGDTEILAAGAIAERYEEMGGVVRYHGKPHAEIYDPVFKMMGIPLDRLIAVGDSLATDIRGANTVGIDSLMIMDGIHRKTFFTDAGSLREDALSAFKTLQATYGQISPTFIMPRFHH